MDSLFCAPKILLDYLCHGTALLMAAPWQRAIDATRRFSAP
jgi:hypothetical protein